jgi:hypothetical protein
MTTAESPLYLPLPNDGVQRVRRLARDLAWGALNGKWDADNDFRLGSVSDYISQVWGDESISFEILVAFEYIIISDHRHSWRLTAKAFDLLNQPPPIEIFISYSRNVSSALAMLIWAELRTDGFQHFLDIRDIALGDDWEDVLEQRVRQSNIFIPVIGPNTLNSPYIQAEINWALDTPNCRLMPVLHAGFTPPDFNATAFPILQEKNLIVIPEDRALAFHNALQQIRGALGLIR